MIAKSPNIVAGEENIQCLDWNSSFNLSKFCNNSLASKEPVVVSLIWWTALAICSASLWSKSCDKDIVQSSQVEWTCISSVSSAIMKWTMVGMWQPDCTVTAWPELIVKGEDVLALGHTWLVAIVPTEYTSHVLLPRPKIFSLVSRSGICSWPWSVSSWRRTVNPCSRGWCWFWGRSCPHRRKWCPSVGSLWGQIRTTSGTSWCPRWRGGVPDRPPAWRKCLSWSWSEWAATQNSYNVRRWSASTNGTFRSKMIVCSSGRWINETSKL